MIVAAGLPLALGSAAALNWGYVTQHEAAGTLPALSVRRPLRSLAALFSDLRWLVGFLVGIGGWVLYVAALRLAPLSLVQAVSAGGIGLLALLAARRGARPTRAERIGVALATGGLLLLALSLPGHAPAGGRGSTLPVAFWLAGSGVAAALVAAGSRWLAAGAGLGAAAGTLYAAGDVATKAAVGGGSHLAFVAPMLAAHGLAFVCLQLAFQRGGALATAGVASLVTNALPIAAGGALFGEALPGGGAGVARGLAFAAVVAGAAALAGLREVAAVDGE